MCQPGETSLSRLTEAGYAAANATQCFCAGRQGRPPTRSSHASWETSGTVQKSRTAIDVWVGSQADARSSSALGPLHHSKRTSVMGSAMSAKGRFCCKTRKSDNPKNLAKADLCASLLPRRLSALLQWSVIDFAKIVWFLTSPRVERISGSRNFRSPAQKAFCNNIGQKLTYASCTSGIVLYAGRPPIAFMLRLWDGRTGNPI